MFFDVEKRSAVEGRIFKEFCSDLLSVLSSSGLSDIPSSDFFEITQNPRYPKEDIRSNVVQKGSKRIKFISCIYSPLVS